MNYLQLLSSAAGEVFHFNSWKGQSAATMLSTLVFGTKLEDLLNDEG